MLGEIQFELSGLHTILLFLIVGGALAILYLEIRKLKIQINSITLEIKKQDSITDVKLDPIMTGNIGYKIDENDSIQAIDPSDKNNPIKSSNQANKNIIIKDNHAQYTSIDKYLDKPLVKPTDKSIDTLNEDDIIDIDNIIAESSDSDDCENSEHSEHSDSDDSEHSDSDDSEHSDSDDSEHSDDINGLNEEIMEGDENYSSMTVNELKNILSERNLPLSGNKTKLIQRIKENM
jgi:hypothetical protein